MDVVRRRAVVDVGHEGGVQVVALDADRETAFDVRPGERIAQLVVAAVAAPDVVEVDDLRPSARGTAGFGSTGR